MVKSCAVVGCKSHSQKNPNIKFYKIPAVVSPSAKFIKKNKRGIMMKLSIKRQQDWVSSLKRGPLSDSQLNNSNICSRHFLSGKY